MELQSGEVVSLANWRDATLTSLRPHAPEPTGMTIVFRETTALPARRYVNRSRSWAPTKPTRNHFPAQVKVRRNDSRS
jgi:hypothetical protein